MDPQVRLVLGFILGGLCLLIGVLVFRRATVRSTGANHGEITTTAQRTIRKFDDRANAARIPPQEEYVAGIDPGAPAFVEMADPRSAEAIVSDVSPNIERGVFRWTFLRPKLQFHVQTFERQRLVMDFLINDRTFADTGTVTLSVYVNGHFLTSVRCRRPGVYHLEHFVPAKWLSERDPVIVTAPLDKVWTAQGDGARLGYVLLAAGFRN